MPRLREEEPGAPLAEAHGQTSSKRASDPAARRLLRGGTPGSSPQNPCKFALEFSDLLYEHMFVWRSPASSTVVWRSPARPGRSGGPRPGRDSCPIRSRRRSGPRRWCGRWRRSAPRSSRSGRGRPSSRSTGCGGSTAATAPGCWRRARRGGGGRRAADRRRADPLRRLRRGRKRRRGVAAGRLHALPRAAAGLDPALDRLDAPSREAEELSSPWSGSGSRRCGRWRGSPPTRSPTASARSACGRCASPAARTSRCARGAPHEELVEQIELPEGTAGRQLDRALELLVDRLLAAPQRRGRTLLGLRLGALLGGGGSWSVEQGLGRPSASARVLRSAAGAAAGGAAGAGDGAAAAGARPRAAGRRPDRARGRRRGAAPAPARRRGARGPRRPGSRGAAEDPPGRLRLAGARALGDADALPGAVARALR